MELGLGWDQTSGGIKDWKMKNTDINNYFKVSYNYILTISISDISYITDDCICIQMYLEQASHRRYRNLKETIESLMHGKQFHNWNLDSTLILSQVQLLT